MDEAESDRQPSSRSPEFAALTAEKKPLSIIFVMCSTSVSDFTFITNARLDRNNMS